MSATHLSFMHVSSRRILVAVALGVLVLTAGCTGGAQLGGGGGDGVDQQQSGDQQLEASAENPDAADGTGGAASGPTQIGQRAIIKTGQLHLQVEDFDAARRNLTAAVDAYGGFVSDSRVEISRVDNATYKSGRLVVRVPRENFSAMMARARAAGEVQSVSTNSKDVTDKLVDIEARLENLRAERDRLRQLYQNASDTEDVIAVEKRLSEVQGEIERLEARQQSLQRQVALSTIRIELREPRPDSGPVDGDKWFDTPVLVALLESVNGVGTSLRALVVAGAYGLPYAVVYGPLVVGVGYGLRRLRRVRTDTRPAETGSHGDADQPDGGDEMGESADVDDSPADGTADAGDDQANSDDE